MVDEELGFVVDKHTIKDSAKVNLRTIHKQLIFNNAHSERCAVNNVEL